MWESPGRLESSRQSSCSCAGTTVQDTWTTQKSIIQSSPLYTPSTSYTSSKIEEIASPQGDLTAREFRLGYVAPYVAAIRAPKSVDVALFCNNVRSKHPQCGRLSSRRLGVLLVFAEHVPGMYLHAHTATTPRPMP